MQHLIGAAESDRGSLPSAALPGLPRGLPPRGERRCCRASGAELDITLAAEHLRFAANCSAGITGRGESSDVEEVLGAIFEKYGSFEPDLSCSRVQRLNEEDRFCVGKQDKAEANFSGK